VFLLLLTIVLSVLQITASDYPFGNFKLFSPCVLSFLQIEQKHDVFVLNMYALNKFALTFSKYNM